MEDIKNMKIRNGFVSNSSSSSFIIALKKEKNEVCPTCGRKDENFFDRISQSDNDDNHVLSRGKDNILNNFSNVNDKETTKEIKKKISKYNETEYDFGYISISYHDENLLNEMERLSNNGKLVVVHSGD